MSSLEHSHSRQNLLTGEWVLVSPQRTLRPWQGQIETVDTPDDSAYDPTCYLCPGNDRAGGHRNPDFKGPFVFDNDFAALSPQSKVAAPDDAMFQIREESGCCRVVCFSEQHNLRLAIMGVDAVALALTAMINQFTELDKSGSYQYVQIFENRGQMMGCSNQHPHAQIWATEHLPTEPGKELRSQRDYFETRQSSLLLDYLQAERQEQSRLVCENDFFVALVPYWATWPFETLLLPCRPVSAPDELSAAEVLGLADVLQRVLSAYDRMFDTSAPYSMGFHPRPSDGDDHTEWQLHIHIYPPLLRSAAIRKHLVGFEMLAMPQRDLTPEVAAEKLRGCIAN
jgi:UDPglucose--hexose-1-phosphate uridylyltransferase